MKRRLTSIVLCILLMTLQFITVSNIAYAEGELQVTTEVTGMTTMINNQPFVPPMGRYSIRYQMSNTSEHDIHDIQILEKRPGGSEFSPVSEKTKLDAGKSLTLTGASYDGEPSSTPNAVEYKVQYTIKQGGPDQQLEIPGHTYVHVIEADFRVTYTASVQGSVFKGEQVLFSAEVESLSNVTLYNLTITDSELNKEIGTIDVLEPGKKAVVKNSIPIEKTTRGNLVVTYDDPMGLGQRFQKNINTGLEIEVRDEEPVSSLHISGKTDMNKIPGPASVKFELTIKNTGNTTLKEVKCLNWDGGEFHTHEALQPGEEITVTHTGNIKPDENYEFLVQGRVDNSNQLIQSTWSTKLSRLEPKVEIQRSISVDSIQSGEPFVLSYVLRNTGNVDLKDVIISETSFGEIKRFETLAAGQEVEFNKELEITENTFSRTVLTALDVETEKEYSYEASEMEFTVANAGGEEVPKEALSIVLQADKDTLSNPGSVEMECIIKNTGQEPLYNLVFTLMGREIVIDNLSVLEPGEDKTILIPALRVEQTETFVVEASGLSADHQNFSTQSQPLTITVSGGSLSGRFSVLRVILIIVILLCIFVIGVLVYTLRGSIKLPFRRKKRITQGR